MAKITLNDLQSMNDLTELNDNFTQIEDEFQNSVLYRDNPTGEPNQMEQDLDMNSYRILNLPKPTNNSEAARLLDVQNALAGGDANLITYNDENVQTALDRADTELSKRTIYVGSVAESLAGREVVEGQSYLVTGWHAGSAAQTNPVGGGEFIGRASVAKSEHNGITIISPTVPPVSAQAGATLAERADNFRAGAGETDTAGNGVFVRATKDIDAAMAGAVGNGDDDDSLAIQDALDYLRSQADLDTQKIDFGKLTATNQAYKFSSSVNIPNRIELDISGSQVYLDASVSIVFGQTSVLRGDNTRIRMAAGHTGAALKKSVDTGAMRVFGFPYILGPGDDDQTSTTSGSIGVDMTRNKYSWIEVHVSGCVKAVNAFADSGAICYYNHIELWAENINYGAYLVGSQVNGNRFHFLRNSSAWRCIQAVPGADTTSCSDNEFFGTFFENIEDVGVFIDAASGNSFYGMVIEGTATARFGYQLAGLSSDNTFFDCRVGGNLDRSKVFTQGANVSNTSFYGGRFGSLVNITGQASPQMPGEGGTVVNGGSTHIKVIYETAGSTSINIDQADTVWLANPAGSTLETLAETTATGYGRRVSVRFDGNTEVVETGNIRLSGAARTPPSGAIIEFFKPGDGISNSFFEIFT